MNNFHNIKTAYFSKYLNKRGSEMTRYYDLTTNNDIEKIKQCGEIIRNGGLVIFPTETVYGIGANALSEEATKKIFLAKGRAQDNPLIVHISNYDMIEKVATISNEIEKKLINTFMPGPFTIILPKKEIVPNSVSAGLETVGVRMPSNEIARMLIEQSKVPIAAPSANISGRPSGTVLQDIKEEFDGKVNAMIDGGKVTIGLESTVVKVINGVTTILRPGKVTVEDIKKVVGDVNVSENVMGKVKSEEKVESPGMKYRHYAPKTKCVLVCGNDEEQITKINKIIKEKVTIVIGFDEHKRAINTNRFISLGKKDNLEEISNNLFTKLREADKQMAELIAIEGVEAKGLGLAIMNRLIRTCEYDIV